MKINNSVCQITSRSEVKLRDSNGSDALYQELGANCDNRSDCTGPKQTSISHNQSKELESSCNQSMLQRPSDEKIDNMESDSPKNSTFIEGGVAMEKAVPSMPLISPIQGK